MAFLELPNQKPTLAPAMLPRTWLPAALARRRREQVLLYLRQVDLKGGIGLLGIAIFKRGHNRPVLTLVFGTALRGKRIAFEAPPVALLADTIGQRQYLQKETVMSGFCERQMKLAVPKLKIFYGLGLLAIGQALMHASEVGASRITHNERRHKGFDKQARFHQFSRAGLI